MEARRKKTTVMLPLELSRSIEVWGRRLGTGKNGFIALGSAFLLVTMSKIDGKQKRIKLLKDLEKEVQTLLAEAREAA